MKQYKLLVIIQDPTDTTMKTRKDLNFTVTFTQSDIDGYGNGYYMDIESDSPIKYGGEYIDLRYDIDFTLDVTLEYITKWVNQRWTGNKGSYKVVGISILEIIKLS